MKLIKILVLFSLVICSNPSFGQWVEMNNIDGRTIVSLHFLDDNMGYATMNNGYGTSFSVMKTTDGGANWIDLNLPDQSGDYLDINFYAEGKGVLVVRDFGNSALPTMVFKTGNDGQAWVDITPEDSEKGTTGKCKFIDDNTGFFATNKFFFTTTDGGDSWIRQEFEDFIISLDFLDDMNGTLGTWNGRFSYKGGMLSTADGGLTWKKHSLEKNYTSILEVRQLTKDLAFAAPVHSWAALIAGEFYKSIDGGATWDLMEIPKQEEDHVLYQFDFIDEMNGVICVGDFSEIIIYSTTDGGQSWIEEGSMKWAYDNDMQLTANSGYIGGVEGGFYKRTGTASISEPYSNISINISPMPVQSGQIIEWTSDEVFSELTIIDQSGKIIHKQYLDQNRTILPQLNPGIYFAQFHNKEQMATTRLVVE